MEGAVADSAGIWIVVAVSAAIRCPFTRRGRAAARTRASGGRPYVGVDGCRFCRDSRSSAGSGASRIVADRRGLFRCNGGLGDERAAWESVARGGGGRYGQRRPATDMRLRMRV